jgi:hypothetical protein
VTSSRPGLLNALPDLAFSVVFLVTWIRPDALGDSMVRWLLMVMLMEFIVLHSAAFMGTVALGAGSRGGRGLIILGFGALYTLFAGAFSLVFKSWWPLASFWGLTLNRLLGVLLGQVPDAEQKAFIMRGWSVGLVFYLVGCLATVALPVPALGLTPPVVAAQHIPGRGLWVDQPQKVLAFGFLYFLMTAWSELNAHAWARRPAGLAQSAAPSAGAGPAEAGERGQGVSHSGTAS